MTNFLSWLAFGALALGLLGRTPFLPPESSASSTANWSYVKQTYSSSPYSFDEGTITEKGNTSFMNNYYVSDAYDAYGDYEVSVTLKGTMGFANTKETGAGLIPWYLDDQNYLLCFLWWSPTEKPNGMRVIEVTGLIDGQYLVTWLNGGFRRSEWNDIWSTPDLPSNSDIVFSVKKTRAEANDTDWFQVYVNGTQYGFYPVRDTLKYAARKAQVGVYGYNDDFTFHDFSVTNQNQSQLYQPVGAGMGKAQTDAWTYSESAYGLSSSQEGDWNDNLLVIPNSLSSEDYTFAATVTTDAWNSLGLLAYYKDDYDYLGAVLKKVDNETHAVFEGRRTKIDSFGTGIQTTDILHDVKIDEIAFPTMLKVQKNGSHFRFFAKDTLLAEITVPSFLDAASAGLLLAQGNAVFQAPAFASVPYESYRYYRGDIGNGSSVLLSAKTKDNPIVFSSGEYRFQSSGLSLGESDKITAVQMPTSYYGNVTTSAVFSSIQADSCYGLFGWFEDSLHYFLVLVTPSGVHAHLQNADEVKEENYSLPAGVPYTSGNHALTVRISDSQATILFYGIELTKNAAFALSGFDLSSSPYVGIACAAAPVVASSFKTEGFRPYNDATQGDFICRGSRPESWTVQDETIRGSFVGGTEFEQTLALRLNPSEQSDYYFASTITSEAGDSASEFKVGLVPYYLDPSNYLFVWLSQWVGGATSITATCVLNGLVVGTVWRENTVNYSFFSKANEMEVQFEGDTLRVFLNRGFSPVFTTVFEGLSKRECTHSYLGFNIFNVTASFSQNHFGTAQRNYLFEEKPAITEIGKRPTSALVDSTVVLPIYTAANSIGDILNCTTEVSDPAGQPVTLTNNRFAATALGSYHVRVSCLDNWGNTAVPVEYDIVVSKPEATSETPLGLIIGLSVGAAGLCALIVLGFIWLRKKRLMKK